MENAMRLVRLVLGTMVGLVVVLVVLILVGQFILPLSPAPPGVDLTDAHDLAEYADLPGVFVISTLGLLLGALLGAWTANAIAKWAFAGWIVALLLIAANVLARTSIPHPAWMWAAGVLLPILAAWLAQRFARTAL